MAMGLEKVSEKAMAAGLEKAIFSARDVMTMGLEVRWPWASKCDNCRSRKGDNLGERRDSHGPRKV